MSMILSKNNKMGSPFFHEFKRQASFFFKEKIKTARLALTDVTPAQLLTEEATNGDLWPPDTRTMGLISQAAFEVEDYWRIVDIVHNRLEKFDRKNWRVAYKALLLLEHLLTHGPLRVADEFQSEKDVIKEMLSFQFVDDNGFNWGLSVQNLCNRILKLLENGQFLKQERARTRKLTRGIQGFGSFHQQSYSDNQRFNDFTFRTWTRSNTNYRDHCQDHQEHGFLDLNEKLLIHEAYFTTEESVMEDHPFCIDNNHANTSLLSAQ